MTIEKIVKGRVTHSASSVCFFRKPRKERRNIRSKGRLRKKRAAWLKVAESWKSSSRTREAKSTHPRHHQNIVVSLICTKAQKLPNEADGIWVQIFGA